MGYEQEALSSRPLRRQGLSCWTLWCFDCTIRFRSELSDSSYFGSDEIIVAIVVMYIAASRRVDPD